MTVSKPSDIPNYLKEASSITSMTEAVEELGELDTLQALPIIESYYRRTPSWLGLSLRILFMTLIALLVFLFSATVVLAGWGYLALLFQRDVLHVFHPDRVWLFAWALATVFIGAYFVMNDNTLQEQLAFAQNGEEIPENAWLTKALIFLSQGITWLFVLLTIILGYFGVIVLFIIGMSNAWIKGNQALYSYDYQSFMIETGIPQQWITPGTMGIAAIILLLLIWKAPTLLIFLGWVLGAVSVYIHDPAIVFSGSLIAFGLLTPLHITTIISRIVHWPYRTWRNEIIRLTLYIRLKSALREAFARHKRRNQKQVDQSGKTAVCREHLQRFVKQTAGPIQYWCCPVCNNDHDLYTHIEVIRGVIDADMTKACEQQGKALHLNVRSWQNGADTPMSSPLEEVLVRRLDDPHEIEVFITQYQHIAPERNWPPLNRLPCYVAGNSNISENTRRQIASNFRKVEQLPA